MSWRVVQGGAMLERVVDVRDGVEVTQTSIFAAGAIIPGEISKSLVERYDGNDEYVRSIVERVLIGEDGDGNVTITPVGKPEEPDGEVTQADISEAISKVLEVTAENKRLEDELETKNEELELLRAQLVDAESRAVEEPKPQVLGGEAGYVPVVQNPPGGGVIDTSTDGRLDAGTLIDYSVMDYEGLKAANKAQNLGLPGNASREALVEALTAHQAASAPAGPPA